jgi:hypothetical protein
MEYDFVHFIINFWIFDIGKALFFDGKGVQDDLEKWRSSWFFYTSSLLMSLGS